jgi:Ca2+/H+ antiporter, TMEM165/GDT1 family
MLSGSKEKPMSPHKGIKVVKIFLIVVVVATLVGLVVRGLWNALMPPLFGLPTLTFWQALGLLILAKIFFGGFHRHSNPPRWSRRMRQRWESMSPEERERFRQGMRCRGPFNRPTEPEFPNTQRP